MLVLLQIILLPVIFVPIRWFAWWMTEVKGLPVWLDYKPFNCKLCLTFWLLIGSYLSIWASFSCLYTGVAGVILACMNALAMYIDQKNKTIKI